MAEPRSGRPHRWRVFVHALDRTGPPTLLLGFLCWLRSHHPDDWVEVVAFRGGVLVDEVRALAPLRVVLADEEPWDHRSVPPHRGDQVRSLLADLEPVDANLLISVSAAHPLTWVAPAAGPIVTWSVEIGEDLWWVDEYPHLQQRTVRWLAGSAATRADLLERSDGAVDAKIVPEFVEPHRPLDHRAVATLRADLGAAPGQVLVLGAGIGTPRKGMDLFVEVAAALQRRELDSVRFAWVGGERDPLHPLVAEQARSMGLGNLRLIDSRPDVGACFQAADVCLHTARADAFPLVALHAVLADTPVVAFAGTGGLAEMLGPGFVGVPYPDVEGIADLLDGLRDPQVRADAVARQRGWVEPRFVVDAACPVLHRELVEVGIEAAGRAARS